MVTFYRPNNRAYTPMINRPINRQALYLTTITTAASTVLPPRLLLLPPIAKPIPYCLPTALQAQRKNCQCWNIWTGIYGQRLRSHVSLIGHPYGDSSAPYLGTAILAILCFRYLLDKNQFIS